MTALPTITTPASSAIPTRAIERFEIVTVSVELNGRISDQINTVSFPLIFIYVTPDHSHSRYSYSDLIFKTVLQFQEVINQVT